jgi:hypothetical protein
MNPVPPSTRNLRGLNAGLGITGWRNSPALRLRSPEAANEEPTKSRLEVTAYHL